MDDSTRVLSRSQPPSDDSTRVLPRGGPGAPTPTGAQAPRRKKPVWLTLGWILLRLGTVAAAMLLAAQLVAGVVDTPLLQWIGSVLLALVLPLAFYLGIRRAVRKRNSRARLKFSLLTWLFGWCLLLGAGIWAACPGIGSEAVGVQGANLARGVAATTAPNTVVAEGILKAAGLVERVTQTIEAAIFGEDPTTRRFEVAEKALEAGLVGEEGVAGVGREGRAVVEQTGGSADSSTGSEVPRAAVPAPLPAGGVEEIQSVAQGPGATTGSAPVEPGAAVPAQAAASSADSTLVQSGRIPVALPDTGRGAAAVSETRKRTVVEVPFELEGGDLLIDVVVNRRFPVRLLVDDRTPFTTIDGTTLRRMGVAPEAGAPTVSMDTPVGPQTDVVVTLDTIAVGGLEVLGPTVMRCNDCRTLTHQGILGANVLSSFQMSVDTTRSVLLFEDRRDAADRSQDIRPYVTLKATAKPSDTGFQPFVIEAKSRAPRLIGTLFARLILMDGRQNPVGTQEVKLPPLPPGGTVSVQVEVSRNPPFEYYAMELGRARW